MCFSPPGRSLLARIINTAKPFCAVVILGKESWVGGGEGRQREALAQGPRPSEARPCEAPKAPRSPCIYTILIDLEFLINKIIYLKNIFVKNQN